MKCLLYIIAILIAIAIIISSAYVVLNIDINEEDKDVQPPTIDSLTGNTTGTTGKITAITVTFSDNENVTEANIYYRSQNEKNWRSSSIINGTFFIPIPKNLLDNWYYYIAINDEAGNGPVGDPSINGSKYYVIDISRPKIDLEHKVFLEEATATWCSNCPDIAEILHNLYDPVNPRFYYISMVEDLRR